MNAGVKEDPWSPLWRDVQHDLIRDNFWRAADEDRE